MFNKLKQILGHSFFIFAIVGFGGMITNLFIFFIFVDILKLWANLIAIAAFLIAGTQNYFLHHIWTFREIMSGEKFSFGGWVKFNLTATLGLVINLVVLNIVLHLYELPYEVIAQFCGVAFGTVFNYLGSRYFVFNKKSFPKAEPLTQ
ncbi:MAG: GtrA family protein [Phycisphaerae bacterium]